MRIEGAVALVTGADRRIGRRCAEELQARGAARVYAAVRSPDAVDLPGAEVIRLDVTDPAAAAAAADRAADVTLLVDDAGISTGASLLAGDMADVRAEMEVHCSGTLSVVRAFAPVLTRNGGGAVVNVLSALSWSAVDGANAYATAKAKAAEWNLTDGLRLELASRGVLVQGVHLGAADTDLTAGSDGPKIDAADVARASLDGPERGAVEVLVDDWSRTITGTLAHDPSAFYAEALAAAARAG